jgi:hypothetical protein
MFQRKGDAMNPRADQLRHCCEWLERPLLLALVTLGHLGLLIVMLRPATPFRTHERALRIDDRGSMQLRFIRVHAVGPAPDQRASAATPLPASVPVTQAKRHHLAPRARPVSPQPPEPSSTPTQLSNSGAPEASVMPSATAEPYVAGGSGFQQRLHASQNSASPKVPGGDFIAGAPRFRMIEESSAGARVVHLLGRLFGASNPHCIDIETWRSMTPQQLIEARVSQSDIDRITTENHCVEPERFQSATH